MQSPTGPQSGGMTLLEPGSQRSNACATTLDSFHVCAPMNEAGGGFEMEGTVGEVGAKPLRYGRQRERYRFIPRLLLSGMAVLAAFVILGLSLSSDSVPPLSPRRVPAPPLASPSPPSLSPSLPLLPPPPRSPRAAVPNPYFVNYSAADCVPFVRAHRLHPLERCNTLDFYLSRIGLNGIVECAFMADNPPPLHQIGAW